MFSLHSSHQDRWEKLCAFKVFFLFLLPSLLTAYSINGFFLLKESVTLLRYIAQWGSLQQACNMDINELKEKHFTFKSLTFLICGALASTCSHADWSYHWNLNNLSHLLPYRTGIPQRSPGAQLHEQASPKG